MEIRGLAPEDAERAVRLYTQSADHHLELDPDFYRVPALVVAHYKEFAERIKAGGGWSECSS